MDWPEPPRWLVIVGSVVIAPLWALFILAWLIHTLVSEVWRAVRHG